MTERQALTRRAQGRNNGLIAIGVKSGLALLISEVRASAWASPRNTAILRAREIPSPHAKRSLTIRR